ncbi:MAG TPA: DUF4184 family protein [Gallionella sp.]|nr:DUF4184 family protein [Gallionella sp.]
MPFTPFHMGPGLAIKAVAGRHFSVLTFGIAQVAMDIEPVVGMIRGSEVLHGPTHTYLAACVIALFVAAFAPLICRPILHRWNQELTFLRLDWLASPESWSTIPVMTGAFIGTLSHVALDSIMHSDITPLAPFSNANGLLDVISTGALHQWCIGTGVSGILVWLAIGWRTRRPRREG